MVLHNPDQLRNIAIKIRAGDETANDDFLDLIGFFEEEPVSRQGGGMIKQWYWRHTKEEMHLSKPNLLFHYHSLEVILDVLKIELINVSLIPASTFKNKTKIVVTLHYDHQLRGFGVTTKGHSSFEFPIINKRFHSISTIIHQHQNIATLLALANMSSEFNSRSKEATKHVDQARQT